MLTGLRNGVTEWNVGAGMVPHFAGLAALGTRGRGTNAVWEGLVRRNEVSFWLLALT